MLVPPAAFMAVNNALLLASIDGGGHEPFVSHANGEATDRLHHIIVGVVMAYLTKRPRAIGSLR